MADKKAKTLVERFGFKDEDLTTAEHDEMLVWCLQKENIEKMLRELEIIQITHPLSFSGCYRKDSIDRDTLKCSPECPFFTEATEIEKKRASLSELRKKILSTPKPEILFSIQAEYPILGYNGFNIGFVDVMVKIKKQDWIKAPVTNHCYFFVESYEKKYDKVFIEIKPKVKSIGELIRQINLYRSHEDYKDRIYSRDCGAWIVLTKTPNLQKIFATQQIYVYEYKPLGV